MIGNDEYIIRYINPGIVQLDSSENIFGAMSIYSHDSRLFPIFLKIHCEIYDIYRFVTLKYKSQE